MSLKKQKDDGKKFRQVLGRLHIQQAEAALLLDRSPQMISNYCAGRNPIHRLVWDKIESLFGYTDGELRREINAARQKAKAKT